MIPEEIKTKVKELQQKSFDLSTQKGMVEEELVNVMKPFFDNLEDVEEFYDMVFLDYPSYELYQARKKFKE